jgi:hypothetical protein
MHMQRARRETPLARAGGDAVLIRSAALDERILEARRKIGRRGRGERELQLLAGALGGAARERQAERSRTLAPALDATLVLRQALGRLAHGFPPLSDAGDCTIRPWNPTLSSRAAT